MCESKIYEWFLEAKKLIIVVAVVVVVYIVTITLAFVFLSKYTGAIVSNGKGCAEVGGEMLKDGGSAVDAMIATLLCENVLVPQSMGIGGGFVATLYTKSTGKIETVIAREQAPAAAHKEMFVGKKVTGAIAAGIPGELLGYWEMHQKYGILPWKELFQPAIKLCKEGHWVSDFLQNSIKEIEEIIQNEESLSEILVKEDGTLYKEGDYMKRPQLAKTFEIIAEKGIGVMYDGGEIGQNFVKDIQEMGGIITIEDLKNFKVDWEDQNYIKTEVTDGFTLYSTPLPTSGIVLAFMLKVMNGLKTEDTGVFWHRVIETFKYAYGIRSKLGDAKNDPEMGDKISETQNMMQKPDFIKKYQSKIRDYETFQNISSYSLDSAVKDDKGTANVAVLASNGDAIVVTSTINTNFGAKVRSKRTGIIINDQMDDFSTPGTVNSYGLTGSEENYIRPGKRPMSSMCPSIILDKNGDVRMLVGAAGGSKITTSVATVILKYIVLDQTLKDALYSGRVHHQLLPMHVDVEQEVPESIQDYLKSVGHKINMLGSQSGFSAVTAIGFRTDLPEPMCDKRRKGSTFLQKKVFQ